MKTTDVKPHRSIALECRGVSHWFGSNLVLGDVNLSVASGQFLALVGPSGCGKSTLLRAIVGTHLPKKGSILLWQTGTGTPPITIHGPGRDRGIVYQHYSLFPFLTAQENVALGLMLDQTSIPSRLLHCLKWRRLRKTHLEQAAEFLKQMKLAGSIHLYPHEMSGGMRQRVAIAQALIMKPEIILLDEPFGALDEATREGLQRMLLTLYAENQTAIAQGLKPPYTLFIVTHELNEALYVGDRVVGLSQYWDWQKAGHSVHPGATIVYDKPSPQFEPHIGPDFQLFDAQREEIRQTVFSPGHTQDRDTHVTYWKTINSAPTPG